VILTVLFSFWRSPAFLGEILPGYVDSGVLAPNRSEFTPAMFKFYVSTPMIIIDWTKRTVKLPQQFAALFKCPSFFTQFAEL